MPLGHGGTLGLVAELALGLAFATGLGIVWVRERRRLRSRGRREAPMRDDRR
jgi:hypothetical protein